MSQEDSLHSEDENPENGTPQQNENDAAGTPEEKPATNYWDKTTMHVFDEAEEDDDSVKNLAGRIATDALEESIPKPVMGSGPALSSDDDEDFSDIFSIEDDSPLIMQKPVQKKAGGPQPSKQEEKPKPKPPGCSKSRWETSFIGREEAETEVEEEEEEEVFSTRVVENTLPLTEIYKNGNLPRSIELLLKKGIVSPEFRRRIYENPVAAAEGVMLPLTPEDREILISTDDMQLSMVMNMLDVQKEEKKDLGGNDLTGLYMKPPKVEEEEPGESEEADAEGKGTEAGAVPAVEESDAAEDDTVDEAVPEEEHEPVDVPQEDTEMGEVFEDQMFKAQDRVQTVDESRRATEEFPSQKEESASPVESEEPAGNTGEMIDVLYLGKPQTPHEIEDTIEVLITAQGIDKAEAEMLCRQNEIRVTVLTGRPESLVKMILTMVKGFSLNAEVRTEPASAEPAPQQTEEAPAEEEFSEETIPDEPENLEEEYLSIEKYPVLTPPADEVRNPADLETVFRITLENPGNPAKLREGLELISGLTGLGIGEFERFVQCEMIPVADVHSLDYGKKIARYFIESELQLKVQGIK